MLLRAISILWLVLMMAVPAHALESEEQKAEFSSSRLIVGEMNEAQDTDAAKTLNAGLDITLTEGWKTYWRSPGDAGFPLLLEPKETATNIENITIHWPYPHRFVEEWGLEVFGFKKHVTVPLTITLKDAAADTQADISISYAVCSDICINEEQELSLFIPANYTGDDAHAKKLATARADLPLKNGGHGLTIADAQIRSEAEGKGELVVTVKREEGAFSESELFIESDTAGLRFPKATEEAGENAQVLHLVVPYEVNLPAKTLAEEEIRITFVDGGKAIEHTLTVPKKSAEMAAAPLTDVAPADDGGNAQASDAPATSDAVADAPNDSLLPMILLALLGGVVLNIMPCVLPVLSIKLLGAVKHGGRNSREVRQSFLATVAGILAFFALLAGLTIAAKEAGHAVGWGFHFQSAEFLTFLTLLVLLFAANLLGWFEIQLPSWLNTHIYDVTDKGTMVHRHHLVGDFATGAFAALMATPCTAPFLGTAVGFALSRGNTEIMVIFLALGAGLALPYLAAALFPAVATWLPKPGAWMVRVKQFMGLLMLLAGGWLLWVIAGQTALWVAAGVAALSVLLGAVLHGGGRWRFLRRKPVVALITLGLLVALAMLPSFALSPSQGKGEPVAEAVLWQPFDEAAIAKHVADGKVVFVDVTADWCLTCKFNKLRVLSREDVIAALDADDVIAMQADMTRPMPDIQAYLKKNDRYGIPFNIVYGPAAEAGIPLSEVLAVDEVLQALDAARGSDS
jgi:suppressor for copper-sensitivity B